MSETVNEETVDESAGDEEVFFYRVQFREGGQQSTAVATISGLLAGTAVMVQTDHGLEPAHIARYSATCGCKGQKRQASFSIIRPATDEEREKFRGLA